MYSCLALEFITSQQSAKKTDAVDGGNTNQFVPVPQVASGLILPRIDGQSPLEKLTLLAAPSNTNNHELVVKINSSPSKPLLPIPTEHIAIEEPKSKRGRKRKSSIAADSGNTTIADAAQSAISPYQRGRHGLRTMPSQVDYYQSMLEDQKAKVIRDSIRTATNTSDSSPGSSPSKRTSTTNPLVHTNSNSSSSSASTIIEEPKVERRGRPSRAATERVNLSPSSPVPSKAEQMRVSFLLIDMIINKLNVIS